MNDERLDDLIDRHLNGAMSDADVWKAPNDNLERSNYETMGFLLGAAGALGQVTVGP